MSSSVLRHSMAYKRHQDFVHIERKKKIIRSVYIDSKDEIENLKIMKQSHRLSKAKVHCSCPMCTSKVSNLGWKHRDKKKLLNKDYADEDVSSDYLKSNCQTDRLVYSTTSEDEAEIWDELFKILTQESLEESLEILVD